jgi:uncharacterized protein YpiB (UPF0302 family)
VRFLVIVVFAPGDWVAFKRTRKYCVRVRASFRRQQYFGSENERIHSNMARSTGETLTKLSPRNAPKYTQADVRALIDLALDVKDRQWFEELTSELKRIQEVEV